MPPQKVCIVEKTIQIQGRKKSKTQNDMYSERGGGMLRIGESIKALLKEVVLKQVLKKRENFDCAIDGGRKKVSVC